MAKYQAAAQIKKLIESANKIVVVQADNPDTDSLASSLALEQILGDLGKEVVLYCGVDLPSYLHYIEGWDRVERQLPKNFDLAILVDVSSDTLLEKLGTTGQKLWLKSRPIIIIDHHTTAATIDYATVQLLEEAVASGEIIYELTQALKWPLNQKAKNMLAIAILSDSLGLMTEATTARSIQIIAELVEQGVKLPELENARRETQRREPELVHYKGRLLQRVEYYSDDRIATLTIPWEEIETYSPLFNPPMLVIDDMRLAKGTHLAICFKTYPDGKVTAKLRSNYGYPVAAKLAEHFGGGGHPYAAGFKVQDGRLYDELKREAIEVTTKLLDDIGQEPKHETI